MTKKTENIPLFYILNINIRAKGTLYDSPYHKGKAHILLLSIGIIPKKITAVVLKM